MKISVRDEREENGKPVPERKTGGAANCGQGETGAAAQMPEREKTEKGKLRKVNGTLMLKIAGAVVFCLVLAWLASMDILKDVHECEWNDTITAEEKAVLRMPGFGMTIYLVFLFLFGLAAVLTAFSAGRFYVLMVRRQARWKYCMTTALCFLPFYAVAYVLAALMYFRCSGRLAADDAGTCIGAVRRTLFFIWLYSGVCGIPFLIAGLL